LVTIQRSPNYRLTVFNKF